MIQAEWSYASGVIGEPVRAPGPELAVAGLRQVGPFVVEAELGRGGMGQVFRVRYQGRAFALKLLLREQHSVRQRLEREAQLVGALEHPGIVKLYGAGSVPGHTFVLYELIPSARPLSTAWVGLSLEERVELIAAVAEAAGYAHQRGVVHRDLKPENVLVDGAGRARVIDFGLATHADLQGVTQTGVWVGTPSYMAPEQFAMERPKQRAQVDVWSLGVLLYEALTERLPFGARTVLELVAQLERGSPIRPSKANPEVSPAVEAVCLRALSVNQDQRQPDGAAFASELRAALAAAPQPAGRRGRWVLVAVLGSLLAGGLLVQQFASPTRTVPALRVAEVDELSEPYVLLIDRGVESEDLLARSRLRLERDPHDVSARVAEAAALQELGDYVGAASLATDVLRDHPQQLDALRAVAGSFYRLRRFAEASAACQRALDVDPRSEFAWVYHSLIAAEQGDFEHALECGERVLAFHPGSPSARAARGIARLALGHREEALADFEWSLEQSENPSTRLNRANALLQLGRCAEALEDLDRVEAELGESRVWQATRIQCLLTLDPAHAERATRALEARFPERADLNYLLAQALKKQGKPGARARYERAVSLEPETQWGRAAARQLKRAER